MIPALVHLTGSICSLFFRSRPPAIAQFVVPIIVDTIQRPIRGFITHICKEIAEIIPPSLAHRNPASPVVLIGMIIRIVATLFHLHPYGVFGGHSSAPRHAMTYLLEAYQSCFFATTRLNHHKMLFTYPAFAPAITNAFPICIGFDQPVRTDNKEPAESFAG